MTSKVKLLHACSFCGKNQTQVKTLVSGNSAFICNECVELCVDAIQPKVNTLATIHEPQLTPPAIVHHLNEHVIGQDLAKRMLAVAVCNHIKRIHHPEVNNVKLDKSNLLLIGNSGVGKTHMVTALSQLLQVPFAVVDATSLSQTGYVGLDPEECLVRLYQAANQDMEKAQQGIIFLDEIDKIGRKSGENSSTTRDVSGEGVQQSLLKIIEGSDVKFSPQGGRKNPQGEFLTMNTRNILFILGGAFDGIHKIIQHRLRHKNSHMGFLAQINDPEDTHTQKQLLPQVDVEDLISFGMIPELVGRIPIILPFEDLDTHMLTRILVEPQHSLIKQFQALFDLDQVKLEFEPESLEKIAGQVIQARTGARGLRRVLEQILADTQYHIHELKSQGIKKVVVTAECVTHNQPPKYMID